MLMRWKEEVVARWSALPLFWRAQIIGWSLFGIIDVVNRQLAYRDIDIALLLTIAVYPVLIALSGVLRWLYARLIPDNRITAYAVATIFIVSGSAAAIVIAIAAAFRSLTGWSIPQWGQLEQVGIPLIHYTFVLSAWSIGYFWICTTVERESETRRALAAEAEALRTEIQHLRLQLDPHFLFNALNGVAEEIPEHPKAALAMMRDLTDYLRHSLAGIDRPVVPIEAEVASLAAYLRIQEARFGKKLRTRLRLDPAAAGRPIANFLLQPLVENAVKHGARAHGLEVEVEITVVADALTVKIANTGSLDATVTRRRGRGIGLQNVRRRLDVHYPGRHSFALRETSGRGGTADADRVVATLVLEGPPCSGS
ncbi:sensor histidine kinase [Aquabacter spiritensis]|uniref:Histidine kinase n=1 Tax=Aquabacter spiritensis TaxID=933073 RepID=A0A4V2UYA9_9HYPH|nr:histidine kinase [Aquabacter spiritensis]TCT06668.1 histidine kinase [Aquabacter spiritensis]